MLFAIEIDGSMKILVFEILPLISSSLFIINQSLLDSITLGQ